MSKTEQISRDQIVMTQYVIYKHPRDYPSGYVVRRWYIVRGYRNPVAEVYGCFCGTLREARASIDPRLVQMAPQAGDDPVIFEVWL